MKLQLYYPVKPASLNQGFGVNPTYYVKFGIAGHNGDDLAATHGQAVYAAHDGMAYYEVDVNQGDGFVIRTNEQFDYNDGQAFFKSIYWHLCSANDPQFKPLIPTDGKGYPVKAGDLIGYADNTGAPYESTGDHLHFGLKPQAQSGEPDFAWYNVKQQNGYLGAIDPTPYWNGLFAEDINKTKHVFYIPMRYGDTGSEIVYLQKLLKQLGYFQGDCTGYYGQITRAAVFQFQKDKVIKDVGSFIAVWSSFGRICGSYTLPILNQFS